MNRFRMLAASAGAMRIRNGGGVKPQPLVLTLDLQWDASAPSDLQGHAVTSYTGVTSASDGGAISGYRGAFSSGSSSRVIMTPHADFATGNDQFSAVIDLNPSSLGSTATIFDTGSDGARNNAFSVDLTTAGKISVYSGSNVRLLTTTAISTGSFREICVQRRSQAAGGLEVLFDGVKDVTTGTLSPNLTVNWLTFSGVNTGNGNVQYLNGSVRRVRLLKGGLLYP